MLNAICTFLYTSPCATRVQTCICPRVLFHISMHIHPVHRYVENILRTGATMRTTIMPPCCAYTEAALHRCGATGPAGLSSLSATTVACSPWAITHAREHSWCTGTRRSLFGIEGEIYCDKRWHWHCARTARVDPLRAVRAQQPGLLP